MGWRRMEQAIALAKFIVYVPVVAILPRNFFRSQPQHFP
jgi:hypothetical protein